MIRHGVLAVRLLANMFAGHLVLAVILGFIATAAKYFFLPGWGLPRRASWVRPRLLYWSCSWPFYRPIYSRFCRHYLSAWQFIRTRAELLPAGKTISEEMSSVFKLAKIALLILVVFAMAIPAFAADEKKPEDPNGGDCRCSCGRSFRIAVLAGGAVGCGIVISVRPGHWQSRPRPWKAWPGSPRWPATSRRQ